ncbi:MAG: isoprenyl transferase [Candidatus Omnitrophota bacterium]
MLDKTRIPVHIAIIMDGNGRWAKRHGLARMMGHRQGLESVRKIIRAAQDLNVRFLTLYAFSSENWKRSSEEVEFLMRSCESFITEELPEMIKNDVRLIHIGLKKALLPSLCTCIQNAEELTKNNKKLCVQLAFNYGSRQEIIDAVRKIASDVVASKVSIGNIDENLLSSYLYTKFAPDPDLLIRTSGEMRISNFLLWQICYTEIYVTKKFWPEFNKKEFVRAIEDYQKRKRRFGGTDD